MSADADQWFEVTASVKVRHDSAHDAELYVVSLLNVLDAKERLFPVGVLTAEPCTDPTVRKSPEEEPSASMTAQTGGFEAISGSTERHNVGEQEPKP